MLEFRLHSVASSVFVLLNLNGNLSCATSWIQLTFDVPKVKIGLYLMINHSNKSLLCMLSDS